MVLEQPGPGAHLADVTVRLLQLEEQLDAGGVVRPHEVLHDAARVLERAGGRQTDAPVDRGKARQEVVRLQ